MGAIVMIFEMTRDYDVIVPMTLTVAVSYGMRKMQLRESIYTMKLARRGHYIPDALHTNYHFVKRVGEIMEVDVRRAIGGGSAEHDSSTAVSPLPAAWDRIVPPPPCRSDTGDESDRAEVRTPISYLGWQTILPERRGYCSLSDRAREEDQATLKYGKERYPADPNEGPEGV
jgi:hypothetical protein